MYTIVYRPIGAPFRVLVLEEDGEAKIAGYSTVAQARGYFSITPDDDKQLEWLCAFVNNSKPAFVYIDSVEDIWPYITSTKVDVYDDGVVGGLLSVELDPAFLEGRRLFEFNLPSQHMVPAELN